jgi:hypothetical protein
MIIYEILKFLDNNTNSITAFAAISALFVSTLAIIKASQDNQKQIAVGKIEEIYELIVYFIVEYNKLYKLELKLEECGDENDDNYVDAIKKYKIELEKLKKNIDLDNLFNKVIRLHVLTNSYLSKDLKLEVLAYNTLFECLIATVQNAKLSRKMEEYPEGFPTTDNLRHLVGLLANKLIKKINMGGGEKSINTNYVYYRDNTFKQNLKLK